MKHDVDRRGLALNGLSFEQEPIARVRAVSSMTHEFVRDSGMAFSRSNTSRRDSNG